MINQNKVQHKPSWDRYAQLLKMGYFSQKMKIRITKLLASIRHFSVKTLRRSKIFKFEIGKIQTGFYKFLIEGVESTVHNT